MLSKENFCILIDGMAEDYDRNCSMYDALAKFDVYINTENEPLVRMTEKLIEANFNEIQCNIIFSYVYPCLEEREYKNSAELYDAIMKVED